MPTHAAASISTVLEPGASKKKASTNSRPCAYCALSNTLCKCATGTVYLTHSSRHPSCQGMDNLRMVSDALRGFFEMGHVAAIYECLTGTPATVVGGRAQCVLTSYSVLATAISGYCR